jgi:hypothetical protein
LKDPQALNQYNDDARNVDRRQLQASADTLTEQVVTFKNCLFLNNAIGPGNGEAHDGVISITSEFNKVNLENCTFMGNDFGDPLNGVSSYVIVFFL